MSTIGGGIESMSRVPMMSDGGAWATDPQVAYKTYFTPQGVSADLIATKYGFSRQDLDTYSASSQQTGSTCLVSKAGLTMGRLTPIRDHIGRVACSITMSTCDRRPRLRVWVNLNPAFVMMGEQGGFDSVILQRYPDVESVITYAYTWQFKRHC